MSTTESNDSLPISHPDLLRRILSFAEEPLLGTCLRVNYTFFEIAGPHLFEVIDAREDEYDFQAIVRGAAAGDESLQGLQTGTGPARTNFKAVLLNKIKRLNLGQHPDWRKPDLGAACGHMGSLRFIHIWGAGSASQIRGMPGPPALTPDKAVYQMGWSSSQDLLRYRSLIQHGPRVTVVIPNVVSSLHLLTDESHIPDELVPMLRNTRILFTGKGHERLDTAYVDWISSHGPSGLSEPQFMMLLWNRTVSMLYSFLAHGAEIYVLKDREDRLDVTRFDLPIEWVEEHRDPRFRLDDLNERIEYTREICGDTQDSTKLVKGRTEYLQLSDTADELDEETMARLRADEAAAQCLADS